MRLADLTGFLEEFCLRLAEGVGVSVIDVSYDGKVAYVLHIVRILCLKNALEASRNALY